MPIERTNKLLKEIDNRFTYHPQKPDQIPRFEEIRNAGKRFAKTIVFCCPESEELLIAFTKIDEAVMFANASIARNEKGE